MVRGSLGQGRGSLFWK